MSDYENPTRTFNDEPDKKDGYAKASITAAKIRERWDKGSKAVSAEQYQYAINHSFMRGDQWVYHHKSTNTIREVPRDPERVQVTANRLWPTSRIILAKVGRRELTFEVAPDSADDPHRIGAAKAEAAIEALRQRDNWESVRDELVRVCWEGGTALAALDWDAGAGQDLGTDEATGRQVGTGDIKTTVLAVTEACTEPGSRDIERGRWWIKATALPPEDVRCAYPAKLKQAPKADSSAALSAAQQRIFNDDSGPGSAIPLTLVLTYYERPNPENPKGTVAVVVNDQIVDGPHPWYFPFKDRLNVVCLRETKVHARWTGDTVVTAAVPLQAALNLSISSIEEHMKKAGNARLMSPMGALDHLDELTDDPGEVVEYVPVNGAAPGFLSPPQMPQWWIENPRMIEAMIDDILGVHDVSRGNAPPNIESGAGLSILAEQDDTPVGGLAKEVAGAFGRYATLVLETYAAKVTETRDAKVQVPGMGPRRMSWTGRDFLGQTTASVPLDAIMPTSKAASLQRAIQFQQFGIIPPNRPDIFARVAELHRFEDFTSKVNPDIEKAQQENHDIAAGQVCLPATFDDHKVHIDEHNAYRKSGSYRQLDDHTRQVVDLHVQAHELLAAEEAAKLQMQAMASPALAVAASADQPDMKTLEATHGIPAEDNAAPPPDGGTPPSPDQGPPDAAPQEQPQ